MTGKNGTGQTARGSQAGPRPLLAEMAQRHRAAWLPGSQGIGGLALPVLCPPSPARGAHGGHSALTWLEGLAEAPLLGVSGLAGLCLLFPCRHHQPHGHGEVVGQAGQLGDKTEFFHLLGRGERGGMF